MVNIISRTPIYETPKQFTIGVSSTTNVPIEPDSMVDLVEHQKTEPTACTPSYLATIEPEEGEKCNGIDLYVCECFSGFTGAVIYRVTGSNITPECGYYWEGHSKLPEFGPRWKKAFEAYQTIITEKNPMGASVQIMRIDAEGKLVPMDNKVPISDAVAQMLMGAVSSGNPPPTIH